MPVAYHIVDQNNVDAQTGAKTSVLRVINIKKAPVLRARDFRSFVYDLAFISANKDFTHGGFFDPEDRRIILDAKDLDGHKPEVWDYFIFQNEQYVINEVHSYENNYAYGCLGRKLRGQEITRIVTEHSGIIITQEVTYTKTDILTRFPSNLLNLTQSLVENP